MSFYSVVGKLYTEAKNLGLAHIFAYKPRHIPQKVLEEESFLLFLWSQLEAKKIRGVVFLQVVAHLKMLDANEKYALEQSRSGLI